MAATNAKVAEWQKKTLQSMYSVINDVIDAKHMLALFLQEKIISFDEMEDINRGYPSKKERNQRFLKLICYSNFDQGSNITAYKCLIDYCVKKTAYTRLKEDLCARFEEIKSEDIPTITAPQEMSDVSNYSPGSSSTSINGSRVITSGSTDPRSPSSMSEASLLNFTDDDHQPGSTYSSHCSSASDLAPVEHSTPFRGTNGRQNVTSPNSSIEHMMATASPIQSQRSPPSTAKSAVRSGHTLQANFNPSQQPVRGATVNRTSATQLATPTDSIVAKETASEASSGEIAYLQSPRNSAQVFPADSSGAPAYSQLEERYQPGSSSSTPSVTSSDQ